MGKSAERADLIIRQARLIDGAGTPSVVGDLAVNDDRISAVGDLGNLSAGREIDGRGLAVAPGFIDVHTHDDRALISDPLMACKVSQGVTTVVTGNCGISLAPLSGTGTPTPPLDLIAEDLSQTFSDFGAYLDRLDGDPPAVNSVSLVGHSTLRMGAMDALDRAASDVEVACMCRALTQALAGGAAGLSTGLYYEPARAAKTSEIIALAEILSEAGAIHTTHMRDEGDKIDQSLAETFTIGRAAGVPIVISHHKVTGHANHGRTPETLALIDQARAVQPIAFDVYPYVAGSTVLSPDRLGPASRVIVTWSRDHPSFAGRDLSDIAAEWDCDQETAAERLAPAGAIYFTLSEDDVRRVMSHPGAMIGSDGLPHDRHPHPRLWGTFPRVLGHYARDLGLFSLEEAVHKMTSLPAEHFGIAARGRLKVQNFADIVIFDPEQVIDRATYERPTTPAGGVIEVLVNGRTVWQGGAMTGTRPGRALRLDQLSTSLQTS